MSDLRQVSGFLLGFRHDIAEILLKVALNTLNIGEHIFVKSVVYVLQTHTTLLIAIGSVEFMQFSVTDNEKVKLHGAYLCFT